jgi:hypothetical protein
MPRLCFEKRGKKGWRNAALKERKLEERPDGLEKREE